MKLTVGNSANRLPFWAFIRRRRRVQFAHFEAAVAAESERRVGQMADAVAALVPSKLVERADRLQGEVSTLREERKRLDGFVPVAVRLRGFAGETGQDHYVLVELNRRTGQLRAAKQHYRQILLRRPDTESNGWFNGGGWEGDRAYGFSQLGAPEWSKIDGDPHAVVLLGETYRYTGDHRVTQLGYNY